MFKNFFQSFRFASRGFLTVLREERSFRFQLFAAGVVLLLTGALPLDTWEIVAVILTMVIVLVLEILNTVLERFVDALKPRIHPYAEAVKDMMAAAVLIASLGAVIVGIIIFVPKIV